MARRFYLDKNNSDLTQGGVFDKKLLETYDTVQDIIFFVPPLETLFGYAYTEPNVPGVTGSSFVSGYQTSLVVRSVSQPNVFCRVKWSRIADGGDVIEETAFTSQQFIEEPLTYYFTMPNYTTDTWSSTDRLMVTFEFYNEAVVGDSTQIEIRTGNDESYVDTPFDTLLVNVSENCGVADKVINSSTYISYLQEYTSGSGNWTAPFTATFTIELWGGGGGGGSNGSQVVCGGGGGGGGGYCRAFVYKIQNDVVPYVVGGGGAGAVEAGGNGTDGESTNIDEGQYIAYGGVGGTGGESSGGGGNGGYGEGGSVSYTGGTGGTGDTIFSGAGGGGAGSTEDGGNADGATKGLGGDLYGGDGGDSSETRGSEYGGGGAGAGTGGDGAGGYIRISYYEITPQDINMYESTNIIDNIANYLELSIAVNTVKPKIGIKPPYIPSWGEVI